MPTQENLLVSMREQLALLLTNPCIQTQTTVTDEEWKNIINQINQTFGQNILVFAPKKHYISEVIKVLISQEDYFRSVFNDNKLANKVYNSFMNFHKNGLLATILQHLINIRTAQAHLELNTLDFFGFKPTGTPPPATPKLLDSLPDVPMLDGEGALRDSGNTGNAGGLDFEEFLRQLNASCPT